ncbi:MAG: LptF/LptG family permease [Acidobacteriota bacterium]
MMKLDRYIFKETLSPALIGLLLYTFVLLMNHFFLLAREAIQKEMPFFLVLKLLSLEFPKIIVLTIPMSVLLGILIGVGRLVADSEVIACYASGIGRFKIFKATFYFALVAAILSLLIYLFLVPASEFEARKTRNEIFLRSDITRDIKQRIFYDKMEQVIIYADEIKSDTKLMERVLIKQEETKEEPEKLILAERGFLSNERDTGTIKIYLEDGEIHIFSAKEPDAYRINKFFNLSLTLSNYQEMMQVFSAPPQRGIQDSSVGDLYQEMKKIMSSPGDPASAFRLRRILAEINQRFAIPFVSLAFCLVSFPLAMINIRGGKGGGFAISILIIILYWATFIIGRDLALEDRIPAWLGIWGANLLMLLCGLLLIIAGKVKSLRRIDPGYLIIWLNKIKFVLSLKETRGRAASWLDFSFTRKPGSRSGYFLNVIDRYIVIHYLKVFVFIAMTVYVLSLVVELKGIIDSVIERKFSMSIILQYFKYYTPGMMKYIIPISSMMSAIVTIASLSKHSEVVAIKSSGISSYRMIVPLIIVSFLFSVLFYFMQDYILPYTNQKALMIKDRIEGRRGSSYSAFHGRWMMGEGKRVFHYKNYESSPPTLIGVTILEIWEDRFTLKKRIQAEEFSWNGTSWKLKNGWERRFLKNTGYEHFNQKEYAIAEGYDYFEHKERTFFGGSRIPEQMSYFELRKYVQNMELAGYDTSSLRVGLHEKISFPLTSLIMVLISIPFAFLIGKKGSLYGVGISLLIIIVYWAVFAISSALGLEGILPPFLSAWAPNIIFGLAGIWGIINIRT